MEVDEELIAKMRADLEKHAAERKAVAALAPKIVEEPPKDMTKDPEFMTVVNNLRQARERYKQEAAQSKIEPFVLGQPEPYDADIAAAVNNLHQAVRKARAERKERLKLQGQTHFDFLDNVDAEMRRLGRKPKRN